MRQAEKRRYVHWYGLTQGALGDLAPHLSDPEIVKWVSEENWLFIPNYGEKDREEAQNRPDPNIWFSLENGTITVGLVCNTLQSVRKMKNLLKAYHTAEKNAFLTCMKGLPDDFNTVVWAKGKPHSWKQTPGYKDRFRIQSNKIDEEIINRIFELAAIIEDQGRQEKASAHRSWLPISPTIDMATRQIQKTERDFLTAITQLGPLYRICLKVKTDAELNRELKKRKEKERREIVRKCPVCGSTFPPSQAPRFCPNDNAFLEFGYKDGTR